MTKQELQTRVGVGICLRGHFRVEITYNRREYACISTNTLAYDRITGSDDWNSDQEIHCGYTFKQAYQSLWDECVRKNNLMRY